MRRLHKGAVAALFSLLSLRLAAMALIPLNDTTEARYGEMARKMLETGNWVTPMHDYGVPFLAKPPLWAWMSAASMGVFGVNEFAARLPALILSLLTLGLVWHVMKRQRGATAGFDAALVLAAAGGFFAAAGTVMTDPALCFSTTLILVSFWLAFWHEGKSWRWMFFIGCGVGLLAKGPVALVLAGMPVFLWTLCRKEWKNLWTRLPWVRGSFLTLLIAAPWYALAEIRTPGFLDYFLIGENFRRFVDKGWHGDQYGFAHAYPFGMIWVFALICFLPWSVFIVRLVPSPRTYGERAEGEGGIGRALALKIWTLVSTPHPNPLPVSTGRGREEDHGWRLFLALWSFAPLVFFTFAANIIWPYPLPALAGLALLFTEVIYHTEKKIPVSAAWVTVAAGAFALVALILYPQKFDHSEKAVIALWRTQHPAQDSRLLFWGNKQIAFSAAFYSEGRARTSNDLAALATLLKNKTQDHVVVSAEALERIPATIRGNFTEVARLENGRRSRVLLEEKK